MHYTFGYEIDLIRVIELICSEDVWMQKLKQSYNRPQSLTTRLNVADMSAELKFRPPYEITEDDLGVTENGILKPHKDSQRPIGM
jgi:hypothetical protein